MTARLRRDIKAIVAKPPRYLAMLTKMEPEQTFSEDLRHFEKVVIEPHWSSPMRAPTLLRVGLFEREALSIPVAQLTHTHGKLGRVTAW